MRALLLGGDDSGSAGGSASEDDFFADPGPDDSTGLDANEELGAMEFSFVPGEKENAESKEKKKRQEEGLVCYVSVKLSPLLFIFSILHILLGNSPGSCCSPEGRTKGAQNSRQSCDRSYSQGCSGTCHRC